MFFASDNASGAAPEVMAAVQAANEGYAPSYGADAAMAGVRDSLRAIFEAPEAAVHLVATGTAANALAIACLTDPWGAVYCHEDAHANVDECGAPEFYTGGAKLIAVPGPHGRMTPDALRARIESPVHGSVHGVQRGMVTITNATEAGTVYTPAAVAELCQVARGHGLPVHMDGARFANALVRTGATPAELTWRAGVDALSFGASKNGCMGVEAVIFFDPRHAWEFELRRKRGGHLFSKHRYLSAQMQAYLAGGLWLRLAQAANDRADHLAQSILSVPGASLVHPTEANAVFARWPREGHRRAHAAGARYYLWPADQSLDGPGDEPLSARLVCSWNTGPAQVESFLDLIRG